MLNFCTHFDKNYLDKGIALYRSLKRHVPKFRLFVLALDNIVARQVYNIRKNTTDDIYCIELPVLEYVAEQAKKSRTWQEYCWTLTSVWINYVLQNFSIQEVIYLDADSYFFGSPLAVFAESKQSDIAIVPHRFPPNADKSQNGIYNVNWVYFRNTPNAMHCLDEWQAQCLEWCYARNENGKYADQKYLDAWPKKYGARVIEHLGANLAPWNQTQYHYTKGDFDSDRNLYIVEMEPSTQRVKRIDPLVFYHFHETITSDKGLERKTNYPLHPTVDEYCYAPYEQEIVAMRKELKDARNV